MQGIFELFFLLGFLGLGLGCLSFLCRFLKAGEEAFFLLGRGFQIAADAFDTDYVKSADLCLDLFLHRDQVEYLLICDKNGNLRTNLSLSGILFLSITSMETVCLLASICACCSSCFFWVFLPKKYKPISNPMRITRITRRTIVTGCILILLP